MGCLRKPGKIIFGFLDFVYHLPSRRADPLVGLQRSTVTEGGNGDGSGADGDAALEIYSLASAGAARVGALRVGRMQWRTVDTGPRGRRHYERLTARYFHPHGPGGKDCLRIGRTEAERVWADGAWRRTRRAGRGRRGESWVKAPIRVQAPTKLPLERGRFQLPRPRQEPATDSDTPESEWEIPAPIEVVPLPGLWRLEDRALVRLSPNHRTGCPGP